MDQEHLDLWACLPGKLVQNNLFCKSYSGAAVRLNPIEGMYSSGIILLWMRALIIHRKMTLNVEDSGLSRQLLQKGDCGIVYSAIAVLVKLPVSASRESPLQHGGERAQHRQPLALAMAVWLRDHKSNHVITLLAFEREGSLLTPLPPGFFTSVKRCALTCLRAGTQGYSLPPSFPTEKLTCFVNAFSLSWLHGFYPSAQVGATTFYLTASVTFCQCSLESPFFPWWWVSLSCSPAPQRERRRVSSPHVLRLLRQLSIGMTVFSCPSQRELIWRIRFQETVLSPPVKSK